ncbi:MAG: hypothetical protein KF784_12220 [Fimbriimonadaceae bacterium]|nr:hypothetical protein [Fimbriimonadaceae bacterium]
MNHENETNPEYGALLAEEMSQEELRVLLKRLGEQEFGDPNPTIGAVMEATGADALTVSKMLQGVRNDQLEEKIRRAFEQRDRRVDQLEARTKTLETDVGSLKQVVGDRSYISAPPIIAQVYEPASFSQWEVENKRASDMQDIVKYEVLPHVILLVLLVSMIFGFSLLNSR